MCTRRSDRRSAPFPTVGPLGAHLSKETATLSLRLNVVVTPSPSPHTPPQVNGWDMTMVTHDQARKRLTKKKEDVVRLLVTRKSLEEAVKKSMGHWQR